MCGGNIEEITKDYKTDSIALGQITVPEVTVFNCTSCQQDFLSKEAGNDIFKFIAKKEKERIDNAKLAGDELWSARQAYEFLGITRQAFSKPKSKYQRGFIFWRKLDNTKVYFKKSVELFKETGDGRYFLDEESISPTIDLFESVKRFAKTNFWSDVQVRKLVGSPSNSPKWTDCLYELRSGSKEKESFTITNSNEGVQINPFKSKIPKVGNNFHYDC